MKTFVYLLVAFLMVFSACKKDKNAFDVKNGLVSYFNFNDNLTDQQAYAQSGTAKITYVPGKKGKAIQFNGIDQMVDFAPLNPQNHATITLALWVKTSESSGIKYFIYGNSFGMLTASGKMGMVILNPVTNTAISDAFVPGEWTHIAGTYDGTNIKIYMNGNWVATQHHPGNILGFNGIMTLGLKDGLYWAGALDELYLYNKVLTDAEIQALYKL